MKHIIISFFVFISITVVSQSEAVKEVNLLMKELRTGNSISADYSKIYNTASVSDVIQALKPYTKDSLLNVCYQALTINTKLSLLSKNKLFITDAIHYIVVNCKIDGYINNQIIDLLKRFTKTDFDQIDIALITNLLQQEEYEIGNLAKVYAFANSNNALTTLNDLLAKPNLSKKDKQDIKLALVRCGNEGYTNDVNEKLKEQVINDDYVHRIIQNVVYTKSKTLYLQLFDAIMSDRKSCKSANNDDETPIICAYRIIEEIAPTIINFPAKVSTEKEIESNDLPKTLAEVRDWIIKNRDTFTIDTSMY